MSRPPRGGGAVLVAGYIIGGRGGCALTITDNNGQTMTQINYNMMHKPTLNGVNMMDRTIDIEGIGECVWVVSKHHDMDHMMINIHRKQDVINNHNSLLAYNVMPYIQMDKQLDRHELDEAVDLSTLGGVGRITFKDNDEGMVWLSSFFVHPNYQGKRLAKEVLGAGFHMIANAIDKFRTIVLNAKEHPTSPVPTNVIRNWYKKEFGAVTLDHVCAIHNLHPCSHKSSYGQYPVKEQRVVRKEGGNILVIGKRSDDPMIVDKIHNHFNVHSICADWS